MTQSVYVEGAKTFTAGEALIANRRVKLKNGSTATPIEVVYADAGEIGIGFTCANAKSGESVAVMPATKTGTFYAEAAGTFAAEANLYGAADGKVDDAASGSVQFKALEAATAAGDIVEIILYPVISTTAGTVSIADAGGFTSETTVEGATQELYQDAISAQHVILPVSFTGEDGTALTSFTAGATPGWQQLSNKEIVLTWDGNATPGALGVKFSLVDPAIDATADIVVHFLAKMAGTTDTPVMKFEAYINAGDTDCAGTDPEITGGTTLTEYTMTIAAADVPSAPASLTLILTPTAGQMDTDELHLYDIWLEVTRKLRTS